MTMNKREKILTATAAVLLVVVAGWFLLGFLGGSLADLRAQNEQLKNDVEEKQLQVKMAARSYESLADWNLRCLPSNTSAAGSEYQNWLMGLCKDVNLTSRKVDIIPPRTEISGWTRCSFSMHGRGSLDQLVRLLDQFYQADHLQQIISLNVKPVDEGSKTLVLTIAIEAVSLPGAVDADGKPRSDQLYQAPKVQLAEGGKDSDDPAQEESIEDYLALIVSRNIFMPYSPPPPPPSEYKPEDKPEPPKPPGFDHLKYTVVTAIVEVNEQRQVWILTRTTGQLHKLVKGQSFQLGPEDDPARAMIGTISPRDVEVISQHDGTQYLVALGDNLQPPLPPENEDWAADNEDPPADAETPPGESQAEPADAEPSPSDAVPSPSDTEPSPSDAEPSPSGAVPSPSDAEPSPSGAVPSPSDDEPLPSDTEPSPSDTEPSPADTPPAETEDPPAETEDPPADST